MVNIFGFNISRKAAPLAVERVQAGATQSGEQVYQNYVNLIYKSNTVAGCVSAWTMTLNESPLKVVGGNHPLESLFNKPNDYLSQSLFWQYVSQYCAIGGNAYALKVRNGLGQTVELHVYSDQHIQPVSKGMWVDHYLYNFNQVKQEIPARDVIHFRSHLISPRKPYLGLSPLALVGRSADVESKSMDVISSTMNNGGLPPSTLKYKGQQSLTVDQIESVKEQYQNFVNSLNRGKVNPLLLPADIDKISEANLGELQLQQVWSKSDSDICGAFRVPPVVAQSFAGMQNSTYNNVREGYKQFTELTRIPLWNLWEETVQLSFADEFPNIDVEFDLSAVQALQPDKDRIRDMTLAAYEKGVVTLNEARVVLGYEPTASGDVMKPAPLTASKSVDEWTAEKKDEHWRKYDGIATKAADEIAQAFGDSLNGLEKEIIKANRSKAFDMQKWIKKLIDATKRSREDLIATIIAEAWKDTGELTDLGDNNIFATASKESADKIAESVGTIRDEIQDLLKKNAGRTEAELTDLLKAKFETLKESRAALIGRTTSTSTMNGTNKKVIDEYNRRNPTKKFVRVWLSRRDAKTRSAHSAIDGQQEDGAGYFNVNGYKTQYPSGSGLPASEACNCRCVTITKRK